MNKIVKLILLACVLNGTAFSQVRLPRLVSDSMILQRDVPVKIWGWAAVNEKVSISFDKKIYNAVADDNGKWLVTLDPIKAGGPYQMKINASNHLTINNILAGDLWVCGGQSNMELPMERVKDKYPDEIANCTNVNIRQFNIAIKPVFKAPEEDLGNAKWESANPASIYSFSAAAYFFAKELYQKYHVPIGLIKCAAGGTPAEAWMSEAALKSYPSYLAVAEKFKNDRYDDSLVNAFNTANNEWYKNIYAQDTGLHENIKWFDDRYNSSAWKTMQVPGYWNELKEVKNSTGVFWFRQEIDVPASMVGKPARLFLGTIIDRDSVYINGKFVGTTGYQYPPRKYTIAPDVLRVGKNYITVRIISNGKVGGFNIAKPYQLIAGGQTIDLTGTWQYRQGAAVATFAPTQLFLYYQPLSLFNGMLAPLFNYSIKGVIWYQGESNAGRAKEYQRLFPDLIYDWRKHFDQGNFPFIYVQLPNFMAPKKEPGESQWAEMREAQMKTLSVPNTAMAVTTDIGEWNDLHPVDKKDVGKRLALAAMNIAYGDKKNDGLSPVYQSMKIDGNKIIISFSNVGKGLVVKGTTLNYFSIAGADKKFVWAKAKIENNKVIVWNDEIKDPVAVRYAWANDPDGANLYNKEGLPASSFRTDDQAIQ